MEHKQSLSWHSLDPQDVASRLDVNEANGLAQIEVERRLSKYGPDLLRKDKEEPFWEELLEEAREPMIILLFVTGIFYAIFGRSGRCFSTMTHSLTISRRG